MGQVYIKEEDILNAKEPIIAHQCSCTATEPYGLTAYISSVYPDANVYAKRQYEDEPGTYKAVRINDSQSIVALYAQYYSGRPNTKDDTLEKRLEWFKTALSRLANDKKTSIALPYKVGCGKASGVWDKYYSVIAQIAKDESINIVLYRRV